MDQIEQKEAAFRKSLEQLMELAKKQEGIVTEEQIHNNFPEMKLASDQLSAIREYLKQNKIGIDDPVNYEDYITTEEKDYLTNYLSEISGIEQIGEAQKEIIFL